LGFTLSVTLSWKNTNQNIHRSLAVAWALSLTALLNDLDELTYDESMETAHGRFIILSCFIFWRKKVY
jgi:hypothetical protein